MSREGTRDREREAHGSNFKFGGVAQLGEHLPCKQGVRSSILLISTKGSKRDARYTKATWAYSSAG